MKRVLQVVLVGVFLTVLAIGCGEKGANKPTTREVPKEPPKNEPASIVPSPGAENPKK